MSEEQQEFGPGNAQVDRMVKWREKYKGLKLKELVILMDGAQRRKEQLEDQLKDINAEFDVLRFELVPGALEDAGVENVRYEGIGRVSTTADLRLSLLKADQPTFFSWLKKNKLDDLIQPTVNSSTLKAWVKGRIKAGKEVPDVIAVTPITRASITKG
jgi:hypothetical protein